MKQDRRGELVHLPDHLRSRMRRIDDHNVVSEDPAEVHFLRGKSLPAPEPATARSRRGAVLLENLQQLADVGTAEALLVFEGQLEQPRLKMAGKQKEVVRVDQALFRI